MNKPATTRLAALASTLLACASLTSLAGPEMHGEPGTWQPGMAPANPDEQPHESAQAGGAPPAPAGAVKRFKDLKVPPGFAFDGTRQVTLDINLENPPAGAAQLTVCSRFERTGERYEIDYGSCSLSAPLTNGKFSGSLSIPDGTKSLIVHIIPVHDPASSRYVLWGLDAGQPKLLLR